MFERAGLGELIDNTHPFEHIDDALRKVSREQARQAAMPDDALNEIPFGIATTGG
jgi:hypothetical protein